ncbi:MAG: glycosyltransferase family 1 protein [Ardenticatenaceae bacterium]|nr:glycosyltransferase family 1 protein [Ardenticatenaceae bacterium]MCB8988317.1 glycosyltransferase family 1 protein [Ardenticatenaceae bacterium]
MRIFMLTIGTRGDVQPFVALGEAYVQRGHEVTLCTSQSFAPMITERGLSYAYIDDSILQFMGSESGGMAVERGGGLLTWMRSALELSRQIRPHFRQMLDEAWQAAVAAQPDMILYHPKALGGFDIAQKLGIPGFLVLLQPIYLATAEFPMMLFPDWPLGSWYNRVTYRVTPLLQAAQMGIVNAWRRQTLGLPKRSLFRGELRRLDNGRPVPVLHAYSRHVIPQPPDWPDTAVTTGYWFLDQHSSWTPPDDLRRFLQIGPPPVYIGFGSIAGKNPHETAQRVIDALVVSGERGLIATGWGGLETNRLPDNIFQIDVVPHDWLFKHISAVVHHGGAGTTAAGLRAGKPSILCPFFGDQPLWARRITALGVGPEPVPQKELTAANLATAIRTATNDLLMRQRAAKLGEAIRAEKGTEQAIAFIARHLAAPQ